MARNWTSSPLGWVLPLIAIGLALANWNANPARAWAWTAAIVTSVVMIAFQRGAQLAVRQSSGDAPALRNIGSVAVAVVFGALMVIIALAVRLAQAYGVADDLDTEMRRTVMFMSGAFLAVTGNALPKMLPPMSSLPSGGARVQAFQRLAGWTWTLCGLGLASAGLALPIDMVVPVSMVLVATAMIVTIVELLRLCSPRPEAHKYFGVGVGVVLGLCSGVGLGTATHNVGVGVAFGVGIGLAFSLSFGGAALPSEKRKIQADPQPLGLNRRDDDDRDGEPRRVRL